MAVNSFVFDEQYYLTQNPDVAAAVSSGQFASGQDHYQQFGRFESRDPNAYFDTSFYLGQYPDVAAAGVNPFVHFQMFGAAEGRLFNANSDNVIDTDGDNSADEFDGDAYLDANPDVAAAVAAGTFADAYEHFALFGQFEDRPGVQLVGGQPIDGPFATGGTGGGANPGETFTLTNALNFSTGGVDDYTGTTGDDTFRAISQASLSSSDQIDGGAGNDVLNISAGAIGDAEFLGGGSIGTAAPDITNVEVINNSDSTATLDLGSVTGLQQLWTVYQDGANADYAIYDNASLATTFGLRGSTGSSNGVDITFAAGALAGDSTVNLVLEGNDGQVGVGFGGSDAEGGFTPANEENGVENVVVQVAAGNEGGLNFGFPSDLETITVTGEGDVLVTSAGTGVTSFDASGTTGGISFTSEDLAGDFTATGGSGDNVLDFSAVTADVSGTISGGAGNDTLTGGAGNDLVDGGEGNDTIISGAGDDVIDGGAGNDTIDGGAGNDVITAGTGQNVLTGGEGEDTFVLTAQGTTLGELDIILDWNADEDTLVFDGTELVAGENDASVATPAASYNDLLALVNTTFGSNEDAAFVYGSFEGGAGEGNFIFHDSDGDNVADAAVRVETVFVPLEVA